VLERELEATARRVASELPRASSGLLALVELRAPFGVPDLTVVIGPPEPRRRRLRLDVPPLLNEVDAGIVSATSTTEARTPAEIAGLLGWPESTINRRIDGVQKSRAVVEAGDGGFVRRAALVPIGTTWAIELKVRDWRRAVTQCRTYLTWADGYILVLRSVSRSSQRELESLVAADGGGLVVADEWLIYPAERLLPEARRLWASEHFIAGRRRP
jgi:hypothetical protein